MTNLGVFLTTTLFAATAFAQSSADQNLDRTFHFNNTATVQDMQQTATLVGGITGLKQVAADTNQRLLTVYGTADQIALAEWLTKHLDQTAQGAAPPKYQLPATEDYENVVSVFFYPQAATVQDLQEVATVVRSIGETRRLFTYTSAKALVVRGTPEQIDLADWLLKQLDQTVATANSAQREYSVPGPGDPDNVVRVFSLKHAANPRRLQDIALQVRKTTQVRRLFTYSAPRIIALRGTPGQVEHANQLIRELDQ